MDLDSLSSFPLVGTMDTKDDYNLVILSTELTTIAGRVFLDLCFHGGGSFHWGY